MNIGDTIFGAQSSLSLNDAPLPNITVPNDLVLAGNLTVTGSYVCYIPTAGLHNIDVNVMPSQVSGSIVPELIAFSVAGTSLRTVTGSAFASGSLTTLSLTNLNGIQRCGLAFEVPLTGSIAFSEAEFNGI